MKFIIHLPLAAILGFVLQIIIHEIGHFIGGLITGWRFLFIQIFNLVVLQKDNKISFMVSRDIGFKCIMAPLNLSQDAYMYTIGGCLFNLMSGLFGLIFAFILPISFIVWAYLWCFSVFGIGMFIINGVFSRKKSYVCSDKTCFNLLRSNNLNKICHNAQLIIAKHLMQGLTYKNMGNELICLCPDNANNDILAYQAVLEFYYHLDDGDFLKARLALEKVKNKDVLCREIEDVIEMELAYLSMINDIRMITELLCNAKKELFLNKINDIGRIIMDHERKGDIHSERVVVVFNTYKLLFSDNIFNAVNYLDKASKSVTGTKFIYNGEKYFCAKQLESIRKYLIGAAIYKRKMLA